MKRRPRLAREATAYHEAAHAVVMSHFGLPIRKVTIRRNETSAGHVAHKGPSHLKGIDIEITPAKQERMFRRIMVSFAGKIAQAKFNKRSVRSWQARGDNQQVIDLAIRVSGDMEGVELLLRWLHHCAKSIVQLRWRQIENLASALLDQETLTGAEVVDIIWGQGSSQLAKKLKALKHKNEKCGGGRVRD